VKLRVAECDHKFCDSCVGALSKRYCPYCPSLKNGIPFFAPAEIHREHIFIQPQIKNPPFAWITFYYHSTCTTIVPEPGTENKYDMNFELTGPVEKYIEKVEFTLHRTFIPPKVTMYAAPFAVNRICWGFVAMKIYVYFKTIFKRPPMSLTWDNSQNTKPEGFTFRVGIPELN